MTEPDVDQQYQAHAEQKLEEQFAQSVCDHCWEFVDDSFDHELGTEVIRFDRCEKCGATRECERHEPDADDGEPDE